MHSQTIWVRTVAWRESVKSCAFSPDGTRIVSRSDELRLWDTSSGAEIAVMGGHREPVTSCAFSPDGTRMASASRDKILKLRMRKTALSALAGIQDIGRREARRRLEEMVESRPVRKKGRGK